MGNHYLDLNDMAGELDNVRAYQLMIALLYKYL